MSTARVIMARGPKSIAQARRTRYHLRHVNVAYALIAGCDQLDTLIRRWENDPKGELPWHVDVLDTEDGDIVWDSTGRLKESCTHSPTTVAVTTPALCQDCGAPIPNESDGFARIRCAACAAKHTAPAS